VVSVLLVHRDAAFIAKAGGVVGDVAGVKPDGYVRPANADRRLVAVRVAGLSEADAVRIYCRSAVPAHLLEREHEEHRRRERARGDSRHALRHRYKQAREEADFEISRLGAPTKDMLPEDLQRWWAQWNAAKVNIEHRMHDRLSAMQRAVESRAGPRDESTRVDHEVWHRRTRHLDLSRLPAPDAAGEIHIDAAALAQATVTKEIP
jgi:hypothetical protein